MRYLNILADDLTGAADTAARCHRFGLPATIFLDIPEPPLPPGALAFTSDSRHLPAAEAARQARDTAASLSVLGARWYKKIDSMLRGNIGSELDALMELLDAPAAVVCPAFPAQRRGLRNGYLAAPELRLPAVHLPSLLREQSRHSVAALSLEEARGGELAARMGRALCRMGAGIPRRRVVLVVDALTDDDLHTVLQAQQEALPEALLCGSAGLAGAFARRVGALAEFPSRSGERDAGGWKGERPAQVRSALLVVGSGSRSAHRQIAFLLHSESNARTGRLPSESGASQLAVSRMIVAPETDVEAIATLDPARPIWLLQQPKPRPGAMLEGGAARRRADHLARISAAAFAGRPADLLVLAGGDTAMRILKRLGVERLSVERELLPGMPLCRAEIGGRPTPVVIKPGNFGGDRTLMELLSVAGRGQG